MSASPGTRRVEHHMGTTISLQTFGASQDTEDRFAGPPPHRVTASGGLVRGSLLGDQQVSQTVLDDTSASLG